MNFIIFVAILVIAFIIIKAFSKQKSSEYEGWRKFSRTYKAKEKFSLLGPPQKCIQCGGYGAEIDGIKEGKNWFCSKECKEKWEIQKKN